jgi:hypothetical protein
VLVQPYENRKERSMLIMKKYVEYYHFYPLLLPIKFPSFDSNEICFESFKLLMKLMDIPDINSISTNDLTKEHLRDLINTSKVTFRQAHEYHIPCFNCKRKGKDEDNCELRNFKYSNQEMKNIAKSPFLVILVETSTWTKTNFLNINFPYKKEKNIIKNTHVNLYDCMNHYKQTEKLEKDNAWYCKHCKSHKEALKTVNIYRAPKVLAVQLRRFKMSSNNPVVSFFSNKKIETKVDFPLNDLDIRPYCIADLKDNIDAIYDLFGVVQHYGGMNSGHYTAMCRNDDTWFNFNDESVTKANEDSVCDEAAYLLFYIKKNLK